LSGHLMPYTIHRQVVRHSYSFGPSLKKLSYYGLC
jgi:hypothetical protein